MIVVTVELWPKGDQNEREQLGRMQIHNDQTSQDNEIGNYRYYLEKTGIAAYTGYVSDYKRSLGFWQLISRSLSQFYEDHVSTGFLSGDKED